MAFVIITIILVSIALSEFGITNGLNCYMCGQYNEGVGSITPCLNYTDQNTHLFLKKCTKSSEKYCVKYVSELSTVRDCATECFEKEIWETKTFCCTEDSCNGSPKLASPSVIIVLLPLLSIFFQFIRTICWKYLPCIRIYKCMKIQVKSKYIFQNSRI